MLHLFVLLLVDTWYTVGIVICELRVEGALNGYVAAAVVDTQGFDLDFGRR